ncbi:MAG: hypothetical protein ACP5MD_01770 [Verrucomicrobiia bacterium]
MHFVYFVGNPTELMANGMIKPWPEVVKLREDVKSGELTLAMFAADLYDVKMGQGQGTRAAYQQELPVNRPKERE